MRKISRNQTEKILTLILIALFSLFCFSLFKNIQYPLLWNDEADTAMFATRIIKFGYPKVHDGKNVINQTQNQNHTVGINKKIDAFIEVDWLQYYFASPFVSLSELTNNMYLKTALIRIPFAIVGFLGLLFMAFSVVNVFITAISKRLFLILFFLLELLSISLVLHLREARYYSPQIFITGVLLYLYIRYRYLHENKSRRIPLMTFVFLLLLLFTFRPAFFAFLILFVLFEVEYLFSTIRSELVHDKPPRQSNLKICEVKKISHKVLRAVTPFAILLILLIPYFIFFKTFSFTDAMSKQYAFNYKTYLIHIGQILKYFWKYEFLSLLVLCKVIIAGMWIRHKSKTLPFEIREKTHLSHFLSLAVTIYIILIARIPSYLFIRYFIVLQPIITIIILLDLFTIYNFIPLSSLKNKNNIFTSMTLVLGLMIFSKGFMLRNYLSNHFYEILHQFKGPLDYIVPYIKSTYENPNKLVIATNYEEYSYMFYLGSKVTIGYVGNNLKEDLKIQPDIVIFRQGWNSNPEIFNYFLRKEKYKVVSFPVYNYPLNNIPEFNFAIPHLFKTKMATNENEKLKIFVRENL